MTKTEMEARLAADAARIAELESKLASTKMEEGRIWPDVSKAVKDGEATDSICCLRGVNADPRKPVTIHISQWVRMLPQIPDINKGMLKLIDKFSFRSADEKKRCKAFLTAWNAEDEANG